ncbi:hypothetical protein ACFP7A_03360 [Sporolactobacillus kofuensis]|uniref:ABC transporter permease n=1 Tax=Sporolactobacillus kofuensis TaxID=269672 RepID=A0ABW1WD78_9BACL|nr:hypothetical protein [Sporolactobacillus kofuensis]MCO7174561.1 hypothetical protein [Sporolactobacillus kofuensis]
MNLIPLIKHFMRVKMYYKVNFLFTLGVPIASILYSMRGQWFHHLNTVETKESIFYWIGYMVVLYALTSTSSPNK